MADHQDTGAAGVMPAKGWISRWLGRPGEDDPSSAARDEASDSPPSAKSPRTWASLLSRCREATRADCVFAVEGAGLVVGRDGDYGRVEVERIAAHVSRAFDFLDALTEIGSSVESLCIMFAGGRWLTAVRISPSSTQTVTLGIVGPFTIIRHDRQRIRNALLKLFANGLPPLESDEDETAE